MVSPPLSASVKNRPRTLNAWASYDWANSVYNLIVTSTIFPVYYSGATREAFGGEVVQFFGLAVRSTVLYSYAIAASFLVVSLLAPVLSGMADYSGRKKRFMQGFTYLGATACIGLYFFVGENVEYGILCAALASIGYAGSLVFYNAFLPEIATRDRMDDVSARGFALGYVGSVLLLIVNLVLILNYETFGFGSKLAATRSAFLQVGVWWIVFAQIAFAHLHDRPIGAQVNRELFTRGFRELRQVSRQIARQSVIWRFVAAFFFYSMGVQTVMLLAPLFGEAEIGLEGDKLILTVLILQLVAIGGSYLFAWIARTRGSRRSLSIALLIWLGICLGAYLLQNEWQFYLLAAFVGLVMGGTQAISRATYAKLVPAESPDTASYFSFYDVSEKVAIVLGTFSYGLIDQLTGSMRNSAAFLILFFLIGLVLLRTTPLPRPSGAGPGHKRV